MESRYYQNKKSQGRNHINHDLAPSETINEEQTTLLNATQLSTKKNSNAIKQGQRTRTNSIDRLNEGLSANYIPLQNNNTNTFGPQGVTIQIKEKQPTQVNNKQKQNAQQVRHNGALTQNLHLPELKQPQNEQSRMKDTKSSIYPGIKSLAQTKSEQDFKRSITQTFGGTISQFNLSATISKPEPRFRVAQPPSLNKIKHVDDQQTISNWTQNQTIEDKKQFAKTTQNFDKLKQQHSYSSKQQDGLQHSQTKAKLKNVQLLKSSSNKKLGFLSSVGGKQTYYNKFNLDSNHILTQEMEKDKVTQQVAVFTTMNVDTIIKKSNNINYTAAKPPIAQPLYINEDDSSFDLIRAQINRTSSLSQLTNTKLAAKSSLKLLQPDPQFKNFQRTIKFRQPQYNQDGVAQPSRPLNQTKQIEWQQIKTGAHNKKNKELDYPELFDRSERTIAATFGRIGDLNYHTPTHRIASFMDFSQRLKRSHLMDLIQYIKIQTLPMKTENEDGDTKTTAEYIEQCLFHGNMIEEESSQVVSSIFQREGIPEIQTIEQANLLHNIEIKGYNPSSSRHSLDLKVDKVWPQHLIDQLKISITRFLFYVESPDAIKIEEISKYKKKWMEAALNLIPDQYLTEFATLIKELFQEIFQVYLRAMKFAIVDYVVRSPFERKRLNIMILPEIVMTAAELQVKKGSYCITKYAGSHSRKQKAEAEIKLNLITNNIVMSQLVSWAHEFRNVNLFDVSCLSEIIQARNSQQIKGQLLVSSTIDLENFFAYLESHLEKSVAFLKNIWFRGAIIITKKFKLLQRRKDGYQTRSWTFRGSLPDIDKNIQPSINKQATPLQQYYYRAKQIDFSSQRDGFNINSIPEGSSEELHENETLEDLIDIRESIAYEKFLKQLGCDLDLNLNGYECLSKDYKRELKYAAGNLMHLQLREIVDRSVDMFVDYFQGFFTYDQLVSMGEIKQLREIKPILTKVKEIQVKVSEETKKKDAFKTLSFKEQNDLIFQAQIAASIRPIQGSQHLQDEVLELPDFVHLQDFARPIFRVELLLGCEEQTFSAESNEQQTKTNKELQFNKSDEDILNDFDVYFRMLAQSLNEISRPEFCKVKVYTQKKYDFEKLESSDIQNKLIKATKEVQRSYHFRKPQNKNHHNVPVHLRNTTFQSELTSLIFPQTIDFDQLMYSTLFKNATAYERYIGRIKLIEKPNDIQHKNLFTTAQAQQQINLTSAFRKQTVQRKQHVASMAEDVFKLKNQKVLNIISEHLKEIKRVKEIYKQFQPLIKCELRKKINDFVANVTDTFQSIEDFRLLIEEVRYYRRLVTQLPEKVQFPMFTVGLLQVKIELRQRVESLLFTILHFFEEDVCRQSNEIVAVFTNHSQQLARNLQTAQDVVDIENFKSSMVIEMANLQLALARQKRCVLFLFAYNDLHNVCVEPVEENGRIIAGECQHAVKATLTWPQQIQIQLQLSEDRHQQQRTLIENKTMFTRKHCDAQVAELAQKIKKTPTFNELKQYQRIIVAIQEIKTQLEDVKAEAAGIKLAEFQLFGVNTDDHLLQQIIHQFEPCYELWSTINKLMTRQNIWQGTSMESIDCAEVVSVINASHSSMIEIAMKTEQKDTTIAKVLAQLRKEIEKLNELLPLIEVLTCQDLKEFHWKKIKQITGSENVDLKKINLVGVIALELLHTIPDLTQILNQAKRLRVLEVGLQEMQEQWSQRQFNIQVVNECNVLDQESLGEMSKLIENHVQKTQQIVQDPEAQPILTKANEWLKKMNFLQSFISTIDSVQDRYLLAIEEYRKIAIIEKIELVDFDLERFSELDQAWHLLIARIEIDQQVLSYTLMPDMLERLQSVQQQKSRSYSKKIAQVKDEVVPFRPKYQGDK